MVYLDTVKEKLRKKSQSPYEHRTGALCFVEWPRTQEIIKYLLEINNNQFCIEYFQLIVCIYLSIYLS